MLPEIEKIKDIVLSLKNQKKEKCEITRFIKEKLGVKDSRAREIRRLICGKDEENTVVNLKAIECSDRYIFNLKNNCYVFLTSKKLGKDIVLEKGLVKRIIQCYSNWDGAEDSLTDLALKFAIPKHYLSEVLNCLDFKHDDLPVLPEDLITKDEDKLVDELLSEKKFNLYERFKKKDWAEIIQKAQKYDEFKFGVFHPFENFLSSWQPPKYKPYKVNTHKTTPLSLLININDVHIGAGTDNTLFWGQKQSTAQTIKDIRTYYSNIINDCIKYKYLPEEVIIASVGDILHSSNPYGKTTKGVQLHTDLISEEMFDAAFNILCEFILELSKIAPITRVYSSKGNHFGVGDSILFKALAAYFRTQENIKFEIFHTNFGLFKIQKTLCLLSHGAVDSIKAKAPSGPKLQSYIQDIFLSRPDLLNETTSKIAIFGDLHHGEMKEFNNFDYILLPSTVRGDNYADALNLHSRPRQQVLLLDYKGIKNILNYYLD